MSTINERKTTLDLRTVDFAKEKQLEGKSKEEILSLVREYVATDAILTELAAIQADCEAAGHSIAYISASDATVLANNKTNLGYCVNCGKAVD